MESRYDDQYAELAAPEFRVDAALQLVPATYTALVAARAKRVEADGGMAEWWNRDTMRC